MGLYHGFDLSKMKFFALEHVSKHERGGDIDKLLLQHKIYILAAIKFLGVNDSLNFKPFL